MWPKSSKIDIKGVPSNIEAKSHPQVEKLFNFFFWLEHLPKSVMTDTLNPVWNLFSVNFVATRG